LPVATTAAVSQSSLSSSQSDDARLARINKVHEASDAMQTQDWKRALELVEPVIVDEPSNTKALSIRETARQELEVQAKMASATSSFVMASSPPRSRPCGPCRPRACTTRWQRRNAPRPPKTSSNRWLSDAERARDAKRYEEAAGLVRRALETAPDSTRARALAQDIERRRKEPQRTGPSPEELAAAKRAQQEADQAQSKKHDESTAAIAAALQTYAAGDAKSALASLEAALAPGGGLTDYDPIRKQSETQMELIGRVVQQSEAARRATESGRTDEALTAWKAVLEADRQILGADRQSRFRQDAATPFAQLLTAQGDELYATGQATGELAGAYQKYREALSYVSGYGPARTKIEAIEKAAIDAYRLAYGRWETDKEAGLAGVEQVLKMLPPDHEYAHRATLLRDKIRGR
jgi:Tfp pilus assembly protein PilF